MKGESFKTQRRQRYIHHLDKMRDLSAPPQMGFTPKIFITNGKRGVDSPMSLNLALINHFFMSIVIKS